MPGVGEATNDAPAIGMAGTQGSSGNTSPGWVVGTNNTPRMTCSLVGAIRVWKVSAEGSEVAARLSVIDTRALGSAPGPRPRSPVDVNA